MALASWIPLIADEAYYWVWTQKPLQLSYFDHPPLIGWLLKLGTFLPEIMLRWPLVAFAHLGIGIWILFLKNLDFTDEQLQRSYWLLLCAPLIGVGSLFATPDAPLLFFWALAAYSFSEILKSNSMKFYILFGISLGLGFCSKYHIVLMPLALVIYLSLNRKWTAFRLQGVLLSILTAIVAMAPVLIWNYLNDWKSFRFQLNHGLGAQEWKSKWLIEYLVSLLLLLTPIYLKSFWQAVSQRPKALLTVLAATPFIFFFLTSFKGKVEANWSTPGWFAALSLVAMINPSRALKNVYIVFWVTLSLVVFSHWKWNWWNGAPLKVSENNQFKALELKVSTYSPLYAGSYQMASLLWFNIKSPVYKLRDISRYDFFDTMSESLPASSTFYLAKFRDTRLPEWLTTLTPQIELVELLDKDLEVLRITVNK